MFNLTVDEAHTFYVGNDGWLVHNADWCEPYIPFNQKHGQSGPIPKGTYNGFRLQSHHPLQDEWAKNNLSAYGYSSYMAPSVTLETGTGSAHTVISTLQNARRDARVAAGAGKWSSSINDELGYIVSDFTAAGFSKDTISSVLYQTYKMLDKIGVPYNKIPGY